MNRTQITFTRPGRASVQQPLTDGQYRLLAEKMAEAIRNREESDPVLFKNRVYSFDCKVERQSQLVFTGVEMTGRKECYIETACLLQALTLDQVYTLDGEPTTGWLETHKLRTYINDILTAKNK